MKALILTASLLALISNAALAAPAATAYEQGLRTAKKRGVPQDKWDCYAKVFQNYSYQRPNGRFGQPTRRLQNNFNLELNHSCGL